jgi:hypothetical protein
MEGTAGDDMQNTSLSNNEGGLGDTLGSDNMMQGNTSDINTGDASPIGGTSGVSSGDDE